MQQVNVVGELWVSYQVELLKPRLSIILFGAGQLGLTGTSGVAVGTAVGSLGNSMSLSGVQNNSDGVVPVFASQIQYTGSLSLANLRSSNTLVPYVVQTTAQSNGLFLPYSLFANRKVHLSVTYNGTTITGPPTLSTSAGLTTLSPYMNTSSISSSTICAIQAAYQVGSQNSDIGNSGVTIQITSGNAASYSGVFVSLTVLA